MFGCGISPSFSERSDRPAHRLVCHLDEPVPIQQKWTVTNCVDFPPVYDLVKRKILPTLLFIDNTS